MNRTHEGKYHAQHKWRMKKPKRRSGSHNQHEEPGDRSLLQAKSSALRRALQHHAKALQQEISGRQPVAAAGGQRDNQVVNQPRSHKHQKSGGRNSYTPVKGTKDQVVRQLAESKIPALAPKLAQSFRQYGLRHDWLRIDAHRLPKQRDQMEPTEMQQKDQPEEANPSTNEFVLRRYAARNQPQQRDSHSSLQSRPKPIASCWFNRMLCRV